MPGRQTRGKIGEEAVLGGTVEQISFRNDETGYVICSVKPADRQDGTVKVVFELDATELCGHARLVIQGRPAHPQGRRGGILLHREKGPVAPHGAVAGGDALLRRAGTDIVVVVHHVQHAAAGAHRGVRRGLMGPAAGDAAQIFHIFHVPSPLLWIMRQRNHPIF